MPVPPYDPSNKRTANKPSLRAMRTTVLHLSPDLEPAEPAREAVDLAVLTQRAGWRALVASSGGKLVTDVERAAVRHTRMPLGRHGLITSWRARRRLISIVQREQPVLLHAHGLETVRHALPIARRYRMPLVADFTMPLPDRAATRRMLAALAKIPAAVRVPSEFMARHLMETFAWPATRMQVIPPGIDTQWCHAGSIGPERLQTLSKLWRLPEQSVIIVMPMPFAPGGGHLQMLEALASLKRDDIFTVLVGDNRPDRAYRAEIETQVNRFGLAGKIIMPDYCVDWSAACWLANVVVVPNSEPRGQALELLVAQAIGRPVIVTDCGANREMVEGGGTSWTIPPNDVRALANALREAATLGTQRRVDLAQRTRDFVAEHFPQAGWFNGMMDLYDSLLIPSAQRMQAKAA